MRRKCIKILKNCIIIVIAYVFIQQLIHIEMLHQKVEVTFQDAENINELYQKLEQSQNDIFLLNVEDTPYNTSQLTMIKENIKNVIQDLKLNKYFPNQIKVKLKEVYENYQFKTPIIYPNLIQLLKELSKVDPVFEQKYETLRKEESSLFYQSQLNENTFLLLSNTVPISFQNHQEGTIDIFLENYLKTYEKDYFLALQRTNEVATLILKGSVLNEKA